jgi:thymidylate kinase
MIISLEGLGASGKTSLLKEIQGENYFIIPEIRDAVQETGDKQKFSKDDSMTTKTNEWFLKIEQERSAQALQQSKIVLMERCFISQIAYNYAKDKLLKTYFSKSLLQSIGNFKLVVPYVAYLKLSALESRERMLVRDKHNEKQNILNSIENYTIEFNSHIFTYYENLKNVLQEKMLVIDANLDTKVQANLFSEWQSGLKPHIFDIEIKTLFF